MIALRDALCAACCVILAACSVDGPSIEMRSNTSAGGSATGEGGSAGASTGGGGAASSSGGAAGSVASSGGSTAAGGASGGASDGGAANTSGGVAGSGGSADPGGSTSSGGAAGSGGTGPLGPLTVYIAGDSTVSTYADTASPTDQAGWGQMLHESFVDLVTIDNRAIGGRTSRRFIEEGRLDDILSDIAPGDYLLFQFGTNDSNKTATYDFDGVTIPYYLDPQTDFKTYMKQYIDGARAHEAIPVLVTPPPRNSAYCTGGNGTGAYAQAMRELGAAESVAVADLNQKAVDYLKAICPAPTPEDVFLLRGDGTVDGTHFQENGARLLAGFVAEGIAEAGLPLAQYLN